MKKVFLFITMLLITVAAFCQITDSTYTITYDTGGSFKDFLIDNIWTIAGFVAYMIWECFLGETSTIKQNSTISMLYKNLVSFFKKKAGKTAVIVAGIFFLAGGSNVNAQSRFADIFKPVTIESIQVNQQALKSSDTITANDNGAYIVRFSATMVGSKTNYSVDEDKLVTSTFSRSGFGLTYSHYIENDGEAFNNYGFGAYILFPVTSDEDESYLSLMVDVSALELFNSFTFDVGIGYDLNNNRSFKENWFIAPGIKITF